MASKGDKATNWRMYISINWHISVFPTNLAIRIVVNHVSQGGCQHLSIDTSNNFYYDVEEKDKDEDEENETNFNKRASTYARTQTSSRISRPEQRRSCSENRSERFLPRDG